MESSRLPRVRHLQPCQCRSAASQWVGSRAGSNRRRRPCEHQNARNVQLRYDHKFMDYDHEKCYCSPLQVLLVITQSWRERAPGVHDVAVASYIGEDTGEYACFFPWLFSCKEGPTKSSFAKQEQPACDVCMYHEAMHIIGHICSSRRICILFPPR